MILLSDYGYISYYGMFQQFFLAISYFIIKGQKQTTGKDGDLNEGKS